MTPIPGRPARRDRRRHDLRPRELEYRDYATLMLAVRHLSTRVVIAAGSRWSRHRDAARGADLPPNVE
ncbi:MAG: hypothetical protein U0531_10155 [Dehalococcoidia bacterium]